MWDNLVLKSQSRVASFMDKLRCAPPNCLLLEGGTFDQRKSLALYWAMSLNCGSGREPCHECGPCIQIRDEVFRDLYLLGPGNKVSVDEVRNLRTIYSQKPHFSWRVVVISDAQGLRAPPANALLKSLEEPGHHNSFVLLAPQRESLFPTLVSRSFILTLSRWADISFDEELEIIFSELVHFVSTGKGWLDRTSGKNKPDAVLAGQIVSRCKQDLTRSILDKEKKHLFHGLSPAALYQVRSILKKAEYCLSLNYIRVDMVMEWLAVSLWKKMNQREKDVYRTRHLPV
jgi:DNA polymerase-3 subunit delta'